MKKGGFVPIVVLVVIALVLTLAVVDKGESPTGLQIAEINEPPHFVGGSFQVNGSISTDLRDFFVDPEGEALNFAVDDLSVSLNGFILTFTAPSAAGEYVVNVQVSDGTNTVYKPLTFVVEGAVETSPSLRGQLAAEPAVDSQQAAGQTEIMAIQPTNDSADSAPQELVRVDEPAISEITISAAPTQDDPILNSTDGSGAAVNTASVNETLTVSAQNVADGDGDSVQNITDWRVNGTSLATLNLPFETNVAAATIGAVTDYSQSAAHATLGSGTPAQAPLWNVTGKVGAAYTFDGTDDSIQTGSVAYPSGIGTVSMWVNPSAFSCSQGAQPSPRCMIIDVAGSSGVNGWVMSTGTAGAVSCFAGNGAGGTSSGESGTLVAGAWSHVACVLNGSHVQLYVNGALNSTGGPASLVTSSPSVVDIGVHNESGVGRWFNGSIDEVLIFNRSLSAAQIQQLYLDGSQGNHSMSWLGSSFGISDVVGVAVTPNDNTSDGTTKFTNNVTIANAHPSIAQVILNSSDGSSESVNISAPYENLTVVIVNAADADNDSVQNITDWRVNGISIAALNMPFETASNSTARDYSLNALNGTHTNGPVWTVSGKVGGAAVFDGVDDYVTSGTSSLLGFTTPFSVEAWVFPTAAMTNNAILGRYSAGTASGYLLYFTGGTLIPRFYASDGGSDFVASSVALAQNQWHHLVGVWNGTTKTIYVNGTVRGSSAQTIVTAPSTAFAVGTYNVGGAQNYFTGRIDEVRLWNRSLSSAQVAQLYQDGQLGTHGVQFLSVELSEGENWSVAVTPNDNQANTDGAMVLSNNVTIQNAAQLVSLNSPVDNYSVDVSSSIPLNCSFSSDDLIINVSVYHSLNGTFVLRESANISGNGSYQFNVSAESLIGNRTRFDRTVLWNCQVCTSPVCSFNTSNATFGPWDLGNYTNISHYPDNFSISLTRNGSNQFENLTGTYASRIFNIGSKVLAHRISWNGTAQSLFRNNTNFESDTTGACPQGWSCSGIAAEVASSTDGQGCVIATGISGTKYIKAGCDADRANLTSDNFVLPLNISRIQLLRAGGADSPSGFFVQRVSDNATLCSAVYGANTDTFAADNCTGLAPYGGELVRLFINDLQTGGFGKVYVDRIMLQDSLNGNLTPLSPGNISFMFRGCTASDCSDYNLSGNYTNGTTSALSTAPGNYFQYQMNLSADNDVFSPFLDTRSVTISYVPVGTFYSPNDAFTQTYDVNGTVNATIANNTFYEYDQYITLNHSTFGRRVRFFARFNTSDVDLRNLTINATTNATAVSIGSGLLGVDFGFSMFVPNLGQGVTVCPNATLVANTNITCPNAVGFTHNDALINNSRAGYTITIEDGDYRVDNIFSTGLAQGAATNLTIYDDTNDFPLGANASRYLTDIVGFYANFTKGSVPANTTDGACQIQFNVSGALGPVIDMTYASGPRVFVRNQTFADFGTFYYNVTCSDAGDTLNTSDDFLIQSPVQFTSRNYTVNLSREDGEFARLVIRNFAGYSVDNITGNVTSLGVLLPTGFLGALHPDIALDLPSLQSYNATVGLTLSLSNESNYTFNASINSVLFNLTLDTVPVTVILPTINETNYNFSVTPASHSFTISDQTNAAQVCSDTSVILTAANTGAQNITTFNMTRSGSLPIRVVPDSIVDYVLPVNGSLNVTVYALINETTPTSSTELNFTIGSITRTVTLSYTNAGLSGWASPPVANSTTVAFGPTLTGKCANGLGFTGTISIPEPYDLGAITAARLVTTFGESTCPDGYATFADLFVNGNLVIDDERPFGSASGTVSPATLFRSNNISMTSGPAGGHWCASGASSIHATFSNTATTYCAACSPSGDDELNFTDGLDNDCDSLTDCDDGDSCGAAACAGVGGLHAYFCPPEENCSNGVDDNQNGLTDCQDVSLCCSATACAGSTGCANLQPNICDYGNYNTLCVIQTNKTVSDLITELRVNDFTVRGPRNTVNIGQFRLNATGDMTLESGVVINGRGRGYGANLGPGAPSSHGGGAEKYDSPLGPNDMGSGSANSAGGGLFRAIVGGRFTNDGAIDTNGTTTASIGSSGAAGGGIFVNASEVYGSGRYYAPGGGPQAGGTAGGGGRIAVWANNAETINRSRFNVTAPGDPSRSGTSVLVDKDTQTLITLEKFNFETIDGTYFPYNVSASGSLLGSNSSIGVNGSFFVMSNSTLSQFGNVFNFTVYSDEMTISSASVISGSDGGGGGTSGSHGGIGEGGLATIHGSALAPRDFGHSADGNPGAGSFAFIGDRFVNNGTITMLGDFSGVIGNSGGAGGSIFVNASNVSGIGVFQARGGGGGAGGTGGGGGRIAVWGNDVSGFSHSQFNVSGGGGGTAGGVGTVILVDADDQHYFVVQNFRFESVDFPTGIVSIPRLVVENATLRTHTNGTSVMNISSLDIDRSLLMTEAASRMNVTVLMSEMNFTGNSSFVGNGKGYSSGQGPGVGANGGVGPTHGGQGTSNPQIFVGSALTPDDFGSGGTVGFGGALFRIFGDSLVLEGLINLNATGTGVSSNSGGSGGAFFANVSNFSGNAFVDARGAGGGAAGGSGGGGKIAIFADNIEFVNISRLNAVGIPATTEANGTVIVVDRDDGVYYVGHAFRFQPVDFAQGMVNVSEFVANSSLVRLAVNTTVNSSGNVSFLNSHVFGNTNDRLIVAADVIILNGSLVNVPFVDFRFDDSFVDNTSTRYRSSLSSLRLERVNVSAVNYSAATTNVHNLSRNIVLEQNLVRVNSSNASGLNRSANITFYNITTPGAPLLLVDDADTGSFIACPSTRCTLQSYGGGVVRFNVSRFTSYSSSEGIFLEKNDSPDPVPAGSTLSYTLFINNSDGNIFNVTLIETYPTHVAFNGSQPAPSVGNNTFILPDLASNQTFQVNITVNVSSALEGGFVLNNTANLTFNNASGSSFFVNVTETTTVANDLPTISQVILNSTDGSGAAENNASDNESLTVSIINATDPDNTSVQNITDWRVNGTSIAVLNMPFETNVSSVGGAVNDYSSSNTDGILGNVSGSAPLWNLSGQVGGAYVFDGVNDFINLSTPASLNLSTRDFSIEAWVKTSSTGGTGSDFIISKTSSGFDQQFVLAYRSSTDGAASFSMGNGSVVVTANGSASIGDGLFHHLVGTRAGTSLLLYVDGVLVDNETTPSVFTASGSNVVIIGGRAIVSSDPFFNGTIDELRIYNRSLSEAQVAQLYADGVAGLHSMTWNASETQVGDVWSVAATPNDNEPNTDGTTVLSNSVTISNELPSIAQVILNSTDGSGALANTASPEENLTVFIINATDPDNQSIQNITDWRVNGTSFAVLNLPFETNTSSSVIGAVRDYSTFNNTVTLSVPPAWNASGRVGGAYTFDGVNDYANTTAAVLSGTTGAFTAMTWIRPHTQAVSQTVFAKDQRAAANNRRMFQLQITAGADIISGSTIAGYVWDESASAFLGEASSTTLTDAWHHVAFVYDGGTAQSDVHLYVDGVDQSIVYSGGGFVGIDDTTADLLVGSYINAAGALDRRFSGTIDEVLIFNRSLTASQINQVMQEQAGAQHMMIVVSNETSIGDVWSVAVTPNDNAPNTDGATVLSNSVTIQEDVVNQTEAATVKMDSPDPLSLTSTTLLNYSITFNLTNGSASNITFNESYPENVSFVNATPSPSVGNFSWDAGNLTAPYVYNISIMLNVSPYFANGTLLNNTVNVSYNNGTGVFIMANATAQTTILNEQVCPFNITSTTTLTANISCPATAFNMASDNVVLDCANNAILYANASDGFGINVSADNVTVRNCIIIQTNSSIPNSHAVVFSSENGTIYNSSLVAHGTSSAGLLLNGGNNTAANVTAVSDQSIGIQMFGTGNLVTNTTAVALGQHALLLVGQSNVLTHSVGYVGTGAAIFLNNAHNSTVDDVVGYGSSGQGVAFDTSSDNIVRNVRVNITTGVGVSYFQSNNNSVTNVTVASNASTNSWFRSNGIDSNNNSVQNFTLDTDNGSVIVGTNISLRNNTDVSREMVNISFNRVRVNVSNVSFMNVSAQLVLRGLAFGDPRPLVDVEDDGTFLECSPLVCTEISFAGGVYIFNVSHFTSYAAEENLTFVINVSIDKLDSPDPVARGGVLSYQIQINSTGNASALNVSLVETYPPNVTFVSSQPTPSIGNNTFTIGNLSNGSSFLVNITVNVSSAVANGTVLNNSIQVMFTNSSGVNSTVNDSELTTVLGAPVIVSIKSDTPDPVVKGSVLNYSILINNTGDDTAFNVSLTEVYPSGVSFITAQPTPVGNATFSIGSLAPGEVFLVNISVTVGSNVANGTILNNSVNMSFRNSSGGQAAASDSELTIVLGFPIVTATKTDSPDPVNNGSTLSYQITITNAGDEVAYNVTAVDGYDFNVTFNGSSPAPSLGNNTFAVGNLSPGQSTTINITVNVSASAAGVLNNTVNVSSENLSGDVSLTSAFAETTVSSTVPAPAPAGGSGSGGGGGAAFTRNTPITRNESVVVPVPVSFPFAGVSQGSPRASEIQNGGGAVSGQVDVAAPSEVSLDGESASEEVKSEAASGSIPMKGIFALLVFFVLGVLAVAFMHRGHGNIRAGAIPKLKEPSALAFSQLRRSVAREQAVIAKGRSSIREKFLGLPMPVPVVKVKPVVEPKVQVVAPQKPLRPEIPQLKMIVNAPAAKQSRPLFSHLFHKARPVEPPKAAVVPVRKNKSVEHVSAEIDKLHKEIARSLRLLEEGRAKSGAAFSLPVVSKPKESWWSRRVKQESVRMSVPARAPSRLKMKKACKVPSAGTRDSARELKKSEQELRKIASFVKRAKKR